MKEVTVRKKIELAVHVLDSEFCFLYPKIKLSENFGGDDKNFIHG